MAVLHSEEPILSKACAERIPVSQNRYQWVALGDVNAFFGLMLDNIADLALTVGLLAGIYGFPTSFALRYMVPGTAIGVFVGDLLFFALAILLARKTRRTDVTAMPLGLDTPSTFGMVFFVLGPAYTGAVSRGLSVEAAALHTWHLGICAIFISGLFKLACAGASHRIRRLVPRAGLLGSLTAVALVLISFLPLVETLHSPVVGFVAVAVIFTALVARVPLPGRIPGALGALLIAGAIHYCMRGLGLLESEASIDFVWMPQDWTAAFRCEWFAAMRESLNYLPLVIPFALATVVGGIDCTESASAAGDEFNTSVVVGIEAIATIVAALCGGVIQTTPYIGHPAYKAMGGRAAYVLATALFVGGAGVFGYFGLLYEFIPKPAILPILMFIGLEITSQSFQATPQKHYPAVALACVPALASLTLIFVDNVFGELQAISYVVPGQGQMAHVSPASLSQKLQLDLFVVRVLANGFIVTSLLWASMLAAMIDRQLLRAAAILGLCGVSSLFGLIHSPLTGSRVFLPWQLEAREMAMTGQIVAGYLLAALLLLGWHGLNGRLADRTQTLHA